MLRKRVLLSVIGWIMMTGHAQGLMAQDRIRDDAPIIAVADSDIYAVSPVDGSARLLVDHDDELIQEFSQMGYQNTVWLSKVSPDYRYIAYTAPLIEALDPAYEDNYKVVSSDPNDLSLLEIDTGKQTFITAQGLILSESVAKGEIRRYSDPIWSRDGQRLYFVTRTLSLRNRVPQVMIEYYDVVSGERHEFLNLKARGVAGIYAFHEGLAVLKSFNEEGDSELALYGPDGILITSNKLSLPGSFWGEANYTMFSMNPVLYQDGLYYGFYPSEGQPALFNALSGETIRLNESYQPALMAFGNSDSPMRLSWDDSQFEDESWESWEIIDREGDTEFIFLDIGQAPYFPSKLALSPRADAVAFVSYDDEIKVTTGEGERGINFKASHIQWGATDYTFVDVLPPPEGQG